MTEQRARMIAATLVKQFGREKFFSISLPKLSDLDLLGNTLRDEFDCTVVRNYARNKIDVYCPEHPAVASKPRVSARNSA